MQLPCEKVQASYSTNATQAEEEFLNTKLMELKLHRMDFQVGVTYICRWETSTLHKNDRLWFNSSYYEQHIPEYYNPILDKFKISLL